MRIQIHEDYDLYFQNVGNTSQTRVSVISPKSYDDDSELVLIEPGRTILIGDVKEQLRKLFQKFGKPALNEMTATESRTGGIFSSRSYFSMRDFLFDDRAGMAPRSRKTEKTRPIYRDTVI